MGLTNGDVAELTYYFATPDGGTTSGESLAAQTYEPRGSGSYDPYTDNRLARLVAAGVRRHRSDETRVKRVIEQLLERPDGRKHFDTLRRAFEPLPLRALSEDEFRWPEVARITSAAIARGRELAEHEEHQRLLEGAYDEAKTAGCSSISTSMRVLEADRRIFIHGVRVQDIDVRSAAKRVLERATSMPRDVEFLSAVSGEMFALVNVAGDAYREVRDELGATRRADKAQRRRESEDLLAQVLGKKRKKERDRLEQQHQVRLSEARTRKVA